MKHLQTLYPEKRVERKREELDKLATTYVEKLFGFLPCLDLANDYDITTANCILMLAIHIQQGQRALSGETTQPLQGNEAAKEASAELTEVERNEMAALITQYGIFAAKAPGDTIIYVSHSTIQGRAMALNDRELYDIVQDIVAHVSAA
jgi:hypothetical protein